MNESVGKPQLMSPQSNVLLKATFKLRDELIARPHGVIEFLNTTPYLFGGPEDKFSITTSMSKMDSELENKDSAIILEPFQIAMPTIHVLKDGLPNEGFQENSYNSGILYAGSSPPTLADEQEFVGRRDNGSQGGSNPSEGTLLFHSQYFNESKHYQNSVNPRNYADYPNQENHGNQGNQGNQNNYGNYGNQGFYINPKPLEIVYAQSKSHTGNDMNHYVADIPPAFTDSGFKDGYGRPIIIRQVYNHHEAPMDPLQETCI